MSARLQHEVRFRARRAWPTMADAGFRRRLHGTALLLMGLAALVTAPLVLEGGLAPIVGAGMGVYGAWLCLR